MSQCKSHKCCLIGLGPSPPNPHTHNTQHITINTTPHPLHTASPQACQYWAVLSPYRVKEGQAATRAAGAQPVRELCCQASNTFGGSLDWKWLSKFILVFQRPISRWTVHKKHFKVFLTHFSLSLVHSCAGGNSKVKLSKSLLIPITVEKYIYLDKYCKMLE